MRLADLAHVLEVHVADAGKASQTEAAQCVAEVVRDQGGRDAREAMAAAEQELRQSPAATHDGLLRVRVGVRVRVRVRDKVKAKVGVGVRVPRTTACTPMSVSFVSSSRLREVSDEQCRPSAAAAPSPHRMQPHSDSVRIELSCAHLCMRGACCARAVHMQRTCNVHARVRVQCTCAARGAERTARQRLRRRYSRSRRDQAPPGCSPIRLVIATGRARCP